jgi:hypothetical protein
MTFEVRITIDSRTGAVWNRTGIHWKLEIFRCYTKKINVELILLADEAEEVGTELNAGVDRLEERPTRFGGESRPSRSAIRVTEGIGTRAYDGRWRRSLSLSGLQVRASPFRCRQSLDIDRSHGCRRVCVSFGICFRKRLLDSKFVQADVYSSCTEKVVTGLCGS